MYLQLITFQKNTRRGLFSTPPWKPGVSSRKYFFYHLFTHNTFEIEQKHLALYAGSLLCI